MTRTFRATHLSSIALLLGMSWLTGCAVGPNYKRPAADVPTMYKGATETPSSADTNSQQNKSEPTKAAPASASLGDEKWWEVFQDPQLQSLIRTALKNNYDVRIAATRVLQAQAQLGITRADQFPSVSTGGNVTSQQNPQAGPIPGYEITQGQVTGSAAWNLDFWGKYRRASESARATLLANEWAQKQVIATLVANLATAYFQLRELDFELEISKRTFNSRSESLKLTKTLEQHGINSLLDVRQSEQLVYTAATEVPDFERQQPARHHAKRATRDQIRSRRSPLCQHRRTRCVGEVAQFVVCIFARSHVTDQGSVNQGSILELLGWESNRS